MTNIAKFDIRFAEIFLQLKEIYTGANLDVASVLVQAFKYGDAGDTTPPGQRSGRVAVANTTSESLIVRHWVNIFSLKC